MSTTPPKKKTRTTESFDDSTFSDLTLKFGGGTRRVHTIILCRKSGWFATALTSSFAEAKLDEITLQDDDPEILNTMLDFCYGNYGFDIGEKYEGSAPATFQAHLYVAANKYDVQTLKNEVEDWFAVQSLESTTKEDRYQALTIMYRMPDAAAQELRHTALKGMRSQLNKMNTEKEFQDLITEQPQLAVDVLRLLGKDVSAQYPSFQCSWPSCSKTFFFAPLADEEAEKTRRKVIYCPMCDSECRPFS